MLFFIRRPKVLAERRTRAAVSQAGLMAGAPGSFSPGPLPGLLLASLPAELVVDMCVDARDALRWAGPPQ